MDVLEVHEHLAHRLYNTLRVQLLLKVDGPSQEGESLCRKMLHLQRNRANTGTWLKAPG